MVPFSASAWPCCGCPEQQKQYVTVVLVNATAINKTTTMTKTPAPAETTNGYLIVKKQSILSKYTYCMNDGR